MVNQSFTMGSLTFDGFVRGDVTLQATVTDAYPDIGGFATWFYNDPFNPTGTDGTLYYPLEAMFQDASPGSFSLLWPTASYNNGIYLLAAGVSDLAGNTTDSPPFQILYLDNSDPWINMPNLPWFDSTIEPISGWSVPLLRGRANVSINAGDFGGGFLKKVEHRYVNAGDDPGTADTPSAFVLNTESYSFPADSMKRDFRKSYMIDTCGVAPGAYDVFAYATDWAGNKSLPMGTTRFVVENFTYLVPPGAVDPVVSWDAAPPIPVGNWALESGGTIRDCTGPVDGLDVRVFFFHRAWNSSIPMEYDSVPSTYTTVATTSLGNLPTLSSESGSMLYTSNDLGTVRFYDSVAGDVLAVFHPMFLDNPQHYSPYGTYLPWHKEFQPFNQRRMLENVTYDLTPIILPAHSLSLDGTVIFNSGHPAVGESVIMELWYTDTTASPIWTVMSTVTGSAGEFSFTGPSDISKTDWVSISIRHPSAYWSDTWMGNIDWDPMNGWSEWLE
jgi:hypothetical protein